MICFLIFFHVRHHLLLENKKSDAIRKDKIKRVQYRKENIHINFRKLFKQILKIKLLHSIETVIRLRIDFIKKMNSSFYLFIYFFRKKLNKKYFSFKALKIQFCIIKKAQTRFFFKCLSFYL